MNAEEEEAKELIEQHLPNDTPTAPSYQELIQLGYNGFVGYYLKHSKTYETMSTTADYDVTMKLAHIDQPRDNKEI